jgi:hypothetical protein
MLSHLTLIFVGTGTDPNLGQPINNSCGVVPIHALGSYLALKTNVNIGVMLEEVIISINVVSAVGALIW